MTATPLLVVLTGPSGVGKDTVLGELRRHGSRGFPVNATTRKRRRGERDGADYYFLTPGEFKRRLDAGDFLEHATVYGQSKGVLRSEVRNILDSGRDAVIRTDIQGARYIKSIVPAAVTIFIAPPSFEVMEDRMRSRGGDPPDQVELRLQTARQELDAAPEFDYCVINDNLDHCVEEIESIIQREHERAGRSPTVV
jgi:guanylate kinase